MLSNKRLDLDLVLSLVLLKNGGECMKSIGTLPLLLQNLKLDCY